MAISQYDIYPTLNGTDTSSLGNIMLFVNNGVHGVFFPIILLIIWIIMFISVLSNGKAASRGFLYSSFICSILALVLSLFHALNSQYMYLLFLMTAIGAVWYNLETAPGI